MECEAGNVSFPQPLAPCGTGLGLFLGPCLEGVKELTRKGRTGTLRPPLGYSGAEMGAFSLTHSSWQEWFHVRKGSLRDTQPWWNYDLILEGIPALLLWYL